MLGLDTESLIVNVAPTIAVKIAAAGMSFLSARMLFMLATEASRYRLHKSFVFLIAWSAFSLFVFIVYDSFVSERKEKLLALCNRMANELSVAPKPDGFLVSQKSTA